MGEANVKVTKLPAVTAATAHIKIEVRKSERKNRESGNVERTGYYVRVTSTKSTSKGLDFSRPKWALYNLTCTPNPEFAARIEAALTAADKMTANDELAQRKNTGSNSTAVMGSF